MIHHCQIPSDMKNIVISEEEEQVYSFHLTAPRNLYLILAIERIGC